MRMEDSGKAECVRWRAAHEGKMTVKIASQLKNAIPQGKRRLFVCGTQSQRLLTNTITTHSCLSVRLSLCLSFPECSSSGLPQDQMNTMKHLIRSNVMLNFTSWHCVCCYTIPSQAFHEAQTPPNHCLMHRLILSLKCLNIQ